MNSSMSEISEITPRSIASVKFSIFSEREIRRLSVLEIRETLDISSSRLGTGDSTFCSICEDPKTCLGHLGHISLNEPMFHPLFIKYIIKILEKVCIRCSRILRKGDGSIANTSVQCACICGKTYISPRSYKISYGESSIKSKKRDRTIVGPYGLSSSSQVFWAKDVKKIFEKIPIDDAKILGYSSPENMIMTSIPVIPNCVRASIESFDFITKIYEGIVILRNHKLPIFDEYSRLLGLMDSNDHIHSESFKPLKQRLSGKEGLFRHYALGKRNDNCGRAVISPDPNLEIDEIGIPSIFSKNIIIKSRERYIRDGDSVILNRQPSLQRHSMMGFRIKITDLYVITINPSVCPAFNADFDGDEMNIFVPQNENSIKEVDLFRVQECVLSPQNDQPVIYPVLDCISGIYLICKRKISKLVFLDCLVSAEVCFSQLLEVDPSAKFQNFFEGNILISCLLPRDFNYKDQNVTIENGFLHPVKEFTSKIFKQIIKSLYLKNQEEAIKFIFSTQKVVNRWFLSKSFSIGYKDCIEENSEESDFHMDENNALHVCVNSGAKGSITNIAQISRHLGQQYIGASKPISPYVCEDKSERNGYCSSSFVKGLSRSEFFMHCQAGREGVISTSMNTPTTGYIQRRLGRFLEDIRLENGITRDAGKKIIRF